MKRVLLLGLLGSWLAANGQAIGQDEIYENVGTLTNAPDVNAETFINRGVFDVFTSRPFETLNTLNFTNTGAMIGDPGFRLELLRENSERQMAANIHNAGGASISAGSLFSGIIIIGGPGNVFSFGENPQIWLRATNLINDGSLEAAPGGLIRLEGEQVDVSRSGMHVLPFQGGFSFATETNFFPDQGIFDLYWGMDNSDQNQLQSDQIVNRLGQSVFVSSPIHSVTNTLFTDGFDTSLSLINPAMFIYTNQPTDTNRIIQAVFVGNADTNMNVSAKFADSSIATNEMKTAVVQLSTTQTNVVTGGTDLATVYLSDFIASETNFVQLTNEFTQITRRPSTYMLQRSEPFDWAIGFESNAVLVTNMFWAPGFTNRTVTNAYAAYSALVTNIANPVPQVENASFTNVTGRVEINAENLNLERARIKSEGAVIIKTRNLTGSSSAVIDSPLLSYELGARSGNLRVKDLAQNEVQRLAGSLSAWSGLWTNQVGEVVTNQVESPPGSGNFTNQVVTNVVDLAYHVLIVDSQLQSRQDVAINSMTAQSTNVVFDDSLRIIENFSVEGESFTVNNMLALSPQINDLSAVNLPNLKRFTNNGFINVPGAEKLGTDRPNPYEHIINTGTNVATAHEYRTDNYENNGTVLAGQAGIFGGEIVVQPGPGGIFLTTKAGTLENGRFLAGGEIVLRANALKFQNYTNNTGNRLILSVTNSLTDSGGGANNFWQAGQGFELARKPAQGSLLGTELVSATPRFTEVRNTWAAEDRGTAKEGYVNNAAIGRLVLDNGADALQRFGGTGTNQAMYVDFLELGPAVTSDLESALAIDPGYVVYFAGANVPIEELTEGDFGGEFRWVRNFAGPNTSVDVVLPTGESTAVNRTLRESLSIDSDADGVANGNDLSPFDGVEIVGVEILSGEPRKARISWLAAAGTTYEVQVARDLGAGDWQEALTHENEATTNGVVTVEIDLSADEPYQFFRIGYEVN